MPWCGQPARWASCAVTTARAFSWIFTTNVRARQRRSEYRFLLGTGQKPTRLLLASNLTVVSSRRADSLKRGASPLWLLCAKSAPKPKNSTVQRPISPTRGTTLPSGSSATARKGCMRSYRLPDAAAWRLKPLSSVDFGKAGHRCCGPVQPAIRSVNASVPLQFCVFYQIVQRSQCKHLPPGRSE